MKFKIIKTSNRKYEKEIEINTLEELLKWYDSNKTPFTDEIIISKQQSCYTLEIYDTYRE